jgi:cation transport protein ChaC
VAVRYGSLMWDPGFESVRSSPALLRGYHRAFCVHAQRNRKTPDRPGLVLGLDRGGCCRGIAFLIADAQVERVLRHLWAREMTRLVYRPRVVPVDVGAEKVQALTFVANRQHQGYAGRLELATIARTITDCCGARGPNADYLFNTLRHLEELGITERRPLRRADSPATAQIKIYAAPSAPRLTPQHLRAQAEALTPRRLIGLRASYSSGALGY